MKVIFNPLADEGLQFINEDGAVGAGINPLGEYNNLTDYTVGDSVSYNGSSYLMYVEAAAGTLPTDTTKWQLLALKGTDGMDGIDGANGADGTDGVGVVVGGTTGQVLAKKTNADYDTEWVDQSTGTSDHSELTNLDYASAGHTGFQPAGSYLTAETDPVFSVSEAANFVAGDASKLSGIEAGADVTDATNVAAAGAVMSETDPVFTAWDKDYADLSNKPTLGTAAAKNIPATGNASATEVVYGSDTRLTDARTPASHGNEAHSSTFITAGDIPAIPDSVDDLSPSQTGNNGKFLKTDGTNASWESIPDGGDMLAATYDPAGGAKQVAFASDIPTQYTDEMAQDAVGNAVGNGLDYDDTTGAISVDETELTHNSLGSKQGGTTNEYYHLTSAEVSSLHAAATVADSTSIDMSITGQQISAAAIFGTDAGTVCQGNDARLSDARTPVAHNQAESTITFTNITTGNATTSAHGYVPIATAPASGLYNYVGITNGETAYTNKALFDATVPSTQDFGDSASAGSAAVAARRDHKHAMPAAITRDSLGLDTDDSPQFAGINIGHASDTTISRVSAGKIAVEGVNIPTISSTDTLTNKTYESPSFVNWNGWVSPNETWTYASASSFTVSGDTTSKYQIGDKILITQTTDKYFIIKNVVYSSPNTTVTVDGFGIYTLADAAITANSYSKMETPQGFPRKEVLLFSGTPAASITLSETYAHFDFLDVWYEGNNDGGIAGVPYYYTRLSAAIPDIMVVAVDLGYLDAKYRIRTSGGIITASGTTVSITGYLTNYSTETIAGSGTVVFTDTQFIPKITRVVGIRW